MRSQLPAKYDDIISLDNLLEAWDEFIVGKRSRKDVQLFGLNLMDNLMDLHHDLTHGRYQHGPYQAFSISDPKPRSIHKASVRDRVLHHAIYKKLYPFFDRTFIADSYSCRLDKGTLKAIKRFRQLASKTSRNNTQTCWVLKCDIRKFFASIDQGILLYILSIYIPDKKILGLLERIITSFQSTEQGKGLPLGNLTSQLLVNIYMNEFDQYVKHRLKVRYYLRYADDFAILSASKNELSELIDPIQKFLDQCLQLELHPDKVSINTLASGVDWLGWVQFPHHLVLRTATKQRMQRKLRRVPSPESLASYLGLIQHGNADSLRVELLDSYRLLMKGGYEDRLVYS